MTDPTLDTIDHVLHDYQVSADAMRWTPEPVRRPGAALTPDQIEVLRRTMATLGAAVANGLKNLTIAAGRVGKAYVRFAHRVVEHDRVRCRVCRPYSNPRPLRLGAEYRRRQKRRTRR